MIFETERKIEYLKECNNIAYNITILLTLLQYCLQKCYFNIAIFEAIRQIGSFHSVIYYF